MEIIKKGWGYEKIIVNNGEYCGKILFFNKHKKCSWHKHILKKETFYLQSGRILLKFGLNDNIEEANEVTLNVGDKMDIQRGMRHQMMALEESELFEFSTQHFEEDSIRIIKGD
jgi:mannose-6-phosphate isomerase-like protein (cupin superfamily)